MLRAQWSTAALTGTWEKSNHVSRQLTATIRYSSPGFPLSSSRLGFRHSKSILIIKCSKDIKSSNDYYSDYSDHDFLQASILFSEKTRDNDYSKSNLIRCIKNINSNNDYYSDYSDHDFLQASLLFSETTRHHRMLRHGFRDETIWQSAAKNFFPFSSQSKDSKENVSLIGSGFFRRFQSPTIFLKSSCDGDYVLPIFVGEFAVERLITEDETGTCPDQYQLTSDLVEKLGYKVMMVKITKRVLNTYFARIIFCKPGEIDILSVDARPSDALNVANRCKAPIYVSKRIVLTDGIQFSFSMGRIRDSKSTYDVLLDSAADGPDLLAEELKLMQNMNLAVREERYEDAAMWREKLLKLPDSTHD